MGIEYYCTALRDETVASPKLHGSLGRICEEIRGSAQSIRDVARGLSLGGIGERRLVPAFRDLAVLTESMYGVFCRFDCDEDIPALTEDAITHLYRIAQEAIANAIKHGAANRIFVVLQLREERLQLMIRDNGCGPDGATVAHLGIGLKTMGFRAALYGGTVHLSRAPGRGAQLACSIPLRPLL
jgi:signal transduction histidine kinase